MPLSDSTVMASRRYSTYGLPHGVADLLPADPKRKQELGVDDIIEHWNLRTMNANSVPTPADVRGFVSTLVSMLPQHRDFFATTIENR